MAIAAPASATAGGTGQVGLTFTGLASGVRYLGTVVYTNGVTPLAVGPTVVSVRPQ
jgi:hypothetical protein